MTFKYKGIIGVYMMMTQSTKRLFIANLLIVVSAITGCASYESLNKSCNDFDASSCFKAADYIWNLRETDLTNCVSDETLCIKNQETRGQAVERLHDRAIEQYIYACDKGNNVTACLRAGSALAIKGIKLSNEEYIPVAEKAEIYFTKACELGSQQGCRFRGTTHRAGT